MRFIRFTFLSLHSSGMWLVSDMLFIKAPFIFRTHLYLSAKLYVIYSHIGLCICSLTCKLLGSWTLAMPQTTGCIFPKWAKNAWRGEHLQVLNLTLINLTFCALIAFHTLTNLTLPALVAFLAHALEAGSWDAKTFPTILTGVWYTWFLYKCNKYHGFI